MGQTEAQRLEKIEEALKFIPLVTKKLAEEEQNKEKIRVEIKKVAKELRELEESMPPKIAGLQKEYEAATDRIKKKEEELLAEKVATGNIQREQISVKIGFERKKEEYRAFLMKHGSPRLKARIEELKDAISYERRHIADPPSTEMFSKPLPPEKIPLNIFRKKKSMWEKEIDELTKQIYEGGE